MPSQLTIDDNPSILGRQKTLDEFCLALKVNASLEFLSMQQIKGLADKELAALGQALSKSANSKLQTLQCDALKVARDVHTLNFCNRPLSTGGVVLICGLLNSNRSLTEVCAQEA